MRIGHGYDVHRLVDNRPLVIGGVTIPFEKGLQGHSDADVLTHAVMDALLGAAGLGDLGRHFPDSDASLEGISSLDLLRRVSMLLDHAAFEVVNIDATMVAQRPKILPYVESIRMNLACVLDVDESRVNVKATTEEHMGFTGAGDGMAAHAVVLLDMRKTDTEN